MSYSFEWTAGPAVLGALLFLLFVPGLALIAVVVVALVAAAALVALAGAILATPFLLVRTLHRRVAERHIRQSQPLPAARWSRPVTQRTAPIARDHCLAPERVDAPIYGGRYRSLFEDLPPLRVDERALHALGRPGGPCDLGADSPATPTRVAAVWPFFGQFIAHDITADRSPLAHRADPRGSATSACRRPTSRASTAPAGRLAVPVRARTTPRSSCSRAGGQRRAAQPGGHRPDRRSAQRRAPVHQPDAGRLHRAAQPARRPAARRRRRRARGLRGGAARGHLALPARDPARVPARPHRRAS